MSLIITFMFEPAKLQMNCANTSGIRTFRSGAGARPVESVVVTAPASGRAVCVLSLILPSRAFGVFIPAG
jgi:hypothetical protein